MSATDTILSLFGSTPFDEKMRELFAKVGPDPEINRYDDSIYYIFKTKGVAFMFNRSGLMRTAFFYGNGRDGYADYQWELPKGLQMSYSAEKVRSILGQPKKQYPKRQDDVLGMQRPCDEFGFPEYTMWIDYDYDFKNISIIIISTTLDLDNRAPPDPKVGRRRGA